MIHNNKSLCILPAAWLRSSASLSTHSVLAGNEEGRRMFNRKRTLSGVNYTLLSCHKLWKVQQRAADEARAAFKTQAWGQIYLETVNDRKPLESMEIWAHIAQLEQCCVFTKVFDFHICVQSILGVWFRWDLSPREENGRVFPDPEQSLACLSPRAAGGTIAKVQLEEPLSPVYKLMYTSWANKVEMQQLLINTLIAFEGWRSLCI